MEDINRNQVCTGTAKGYAVCSRCELDPSFADPKLTVQLHHWQDERYVV